MLPRTVSCEECGERAIVRGYGRVEYTWHQTDHVATTLEIELVRVTIDCPTCGVRVQEHRPVGHDGDQVFSTSNDQEAGLSSHSA
jgi:DNA-directed RNA polymerase subunit RPC12/RpoP